MTKDTTEIALNLERAVEEGEVTFKVAVNKLAEAAIKEAYKLGHEHGLAAHDCMDATRCEDYPECDCLYIEGCKPRE